ncbi:MAG TPA: hypothetical protein VK253_01880 [Candidatus Binatia bacterium]|nr:hypothetical protein [Candidatus Binatia bacterium]
MQSKTHPLSKTLSLIAVLVLLLSPLVMTQVSGLQLTTTSEYTNYVHNYVNSATGNYTLIEKPFFPVMINNSQILIGGNWTIIAPLDGGHNYHVYCYGAWVNTSAAAKTDYDIYVYNPQGILESSHTEAAGFPEHLGTTTNDSLFTPKQSGNYSFVIKNDPRESEGAQQATFMIIENLELDKWHTLYIEGKNTDSSPSFHTSWAYEFVTNESKVELYVKVPQTLDMYEARLYLMNDAKSPSINSFPLPWEPGLYGNVSTRLGGYNFENEGFRGVAYASCEFRGQAMFLNYTSTNKVPNLYQLVLIGEEGSGNIEFILKSKFGNASLTSLTNQTRVLPNTPKEIAYISNNASLENAQLSYTTNNWTSVARLDMSISNQTCNATIPGQTAGKVVQYRVDASDVLKNNMTATGNYTVKQQIALNISAVKDPIKLGENITVTGKMTPNDNSSRVKVQFYSSNSTQTLNCTVSQNGTFMATYKPGTSGLWAVSATSPETQTSWRVDSEQLALTVSEPPFYVKYSLYIALGLIAASAVGGAVWFLKFREK